MSTSRPCAGSPSARKRVGARGSHSSAPPIVRAGMAPWWISAKVDSAMPPELAVSARLLLGGLFAYSCTLKVREPAQFASAIKAFGILPTRLATPAAACVIAFEAIVAVTLLSGVGLALGSGVLVVLLLLDRARFLGQEPALMMRPVMPLASR